MKTQKVNFSKKGANEPPTVQFFESPLRHRFEEDKEEELPPEPTEFRNFRNELLDQCNSNFDAKFRKLRDFDEQPNKQSTISHSPYPPKQHQRTQSKSPMRDVEGYIQGSIDTQMTESQITNKKAYTWAFGKNQEGELSLGANQDTFLPRFVTGLQGGSAKYIASSNHHTAIVNSEGYLYVCGSSLHNKLGIENLMKTCINKFQIVPALAKRKVKQVACSDYHTLCLLEDCSVYQFGGTLNKEKKEKKRSSSLSGQINPGQVQAIQALYGKDIVQIDCGDFHSVALDANGDLYTWGGGQSSYNKGQCGHGHNKFVEFPEKVQALASKRITKVTCGGFHTLCLTSDSEVYAFGSGVYGECGYGEFLDTNKPRLVKFPLESQQIVEELDNFEEDENNALDMYLRDQPIIVNIATGGRHSLALTSKGRLYTFGYGQNGQLGLRNNSNYSKPQHVRDLESKRVTQICAGWNHSLILTEQGDLFATGHNQNGQLGLGDKEPRTCFTHVYSFGNKRIQQIFAGGNHSWVVLEEMMPIRENYIPPSPIKEARDERSRSRSNTPHRPKSGIAAMRTLESGSKQQQVRSIMKQHQSPFQDVKTTENTLKNPVLSYSQKKPNVGLLNSKAGQNMGNQKVQKVSEEEEFVQKIMEVQQQQLKKANYFIQVTYCDTEFCHRFINFEIHQQFIKTFEAQLEEYIQSSYQQEKGVLYHRIQEVPLQMSQPKQSLPGDRLLKENQEELSEINEEEDEEESSKSYTLCLICNPAACGYDKQFEIWKQQQEADGKIKKIVLNQGNAFRAVPADENQQPLIGKIVFMKDIDIEGAEFEETMSKWMLNFHRKMSKYCVKKPRYSELRPMKYSLT